MIELHEYIDKELYPIENKTLDHLLDFLQTHNKDYFIVKHPEKTRTVEEKRELIEENERVYRLFPQIIIVQGSALTYHTPEKDSKYVAHFSNGEERINTKRLKKNIGIPKRRDLRFYQGDLVDLIGLESGEVSPIMPTTDKVDHLTFDNELLAQGMKNFKGRYFLYTFDMAITQAYSLYANINDVYDAMKIIHPDKIKRVQNISR